MKNADTTPLYEICYDTVCGPASTEIFFLNKFEADQYVLGKYTNDNDITIRTRKAVLVDNQYRLLGGTPHIQSYSPEQCKADRREAILNKLTQAERDILDLE